MREAEAKLPICDITPFTLQDFPNHTACILWFGGCNFRCAYCHNPELVTGKKRRLPYELIWKFLEQRSRLLDGVVLSGGECTMAPGLPDFIRKVRTLGYRIKLDTNGSNPGMLRELLQETLLDYVAMDYKAPQEKFREVTGWDGWELFQESLQLLCKTKIPVEIRTTVHTSLLQEEDVTDIIVDLERKHYRGTYYVQHFNSGKTLLPLITKPRRLRMDALPEPQTFTVDSRN